ncbi:hypothetical protein EON63_09310 [archaeon]|nr:MAG: hypothetical protein EON63_09310 [archaeon]
MTFFGVITQTFSFEVTTPENTYVTFQVNDEDVLSHDFIAFTSLPVTCMRTGFRTLRLHDITGRTDQDFEYASLFIRVGVEALPSKGP